MADQTQDQSRPGAQIVALSDVAKDLRFPTVALLEAYWHQLRGTRLVPARSEVDPRQIEDSLEYAFILERVAPGMARFRLAGMHLSDLMGMEVRGMPVTAFFTPEARKPLSDAMEAVFDAPAIVRLTLNGETGIGRPGLDARLLLLPLKSDFGDVSRALGCLVTNGPVGRAPRRFSIAHEEITPIAGPEHAGDRRIGGWSRTAGHGVQKPVARPPAATGALAEPPAAYTPPMTDTAPAPTPPRPPRAGGRPNLYIVSSED
ncbi:MAG: PAS domain-containing protein [Pseudomonadota bacterium]